MEDLFPPRGETRALEEAAEQSGLEPALVERIWTTVGFAAPPGEEVSDDDLQLLRYIAAALQAGFPLVALLQLVRVYGQALAQIADAEVRLFHMYVHEPLMREGVPGVQIAEEMQGLAADLLPLAAPMMDLVHKRLLAHFVDQDVIGHMEADLDPSDRLDLDLGHVRVAVAFADLAGYTRMTEELGDEHAVDVVERFVADIEHTLPDDARIIKTIGDEVMVVASDPAALVDWAVGFQQLHRARPLPRIGMHHGTVVYRDGDYYGREVNQAARVSARSGAGEVLVTREVVDAAGPHLTFERIGEVRLKGFSDATELFLARSTG
jgi:adenylate cyclase